MPASEQALCMIAVSTLSTSTARATRRPCRATLPSSAFRALRVSTSTAARRAIVAWFANVRSACSRSREGSIESDGSSAQMNPLREPSRSIKGTSSQWCDQARGPAHRAASCTSSGFGERRRDGVFDQIAALDLELRHEQHVRSASVRTNQTRDRPASSRGSGRGEAAVAAGRRRPSRTRGHARFRGRPPRGRPRPSRAR